MASEKTPAEIAAGVAAGLVCFSVFVLNSAAIGAWICLLSIPVLIIMFWIFRTGVGGGSHLRYRTRRPLNSCAACGHTWHPRGHDLSHNCPRCGAS